MRKLLLLVAITGLVAGCDTCRDLDSVARPGLDAGPNTDAGGSDAADSARPDLGADDAGADVSDGGTSTDGGDAGDAGEPDMQVVPEGCPRTVTGAPQWATHRVLLPKLDQAPDGSAEGFLAGSELSLTASSPESGGQFGLAFVLDIGSDSLARNVVFDADVDFDDRDTYELFDLSYQGIEWERVAIMGDDDQANQFHYIARGQSPDCIGDGISASVGDFLVEEVGAQPGDGSILIRDCDELDGGVGVTGASGPTGRVFLTYADSGQTALALQSMGGDATETTGPTAGAWSDAVAASRRELALYPSATSQMWNAWFPTRMRTVQSLDLGTVGDIDAEWLFESCHVAVGAAAGADAISISAVDCAGAECAVATSGFLVDAAVDDVSVAALPGGGFVAAYLTSGADGGLFINVFDDRFQPVALPDGAMPLRISQSPPAIEDIEVAALADGADVVIGVAFSTVPIEGNAIADSIEVAFVRLQMP